MAVRGSLFQSFGNLVADVVETAQEASYDELMRKVEVIVIEELNRFFPRVLSRMNSQRMNFSNDWAKAYSSPPPLSTDYFLEKQVKFDATRPEYFKGRFALSKGKNILAKRGNRKGKPRYDHTRSLHYHIGKLAKNSQVGKVIFQSSGGLGSRTTSRSNTDPSKGKIVNGKPKRFGLRGGLVNARWQDIVSEEYLRLGRLKRAKPINGYKKTANPDYIKRPDGRVISLARAIAEGHITINIQGSFFKNIAEHDQGFLNFLIKHTNLLMIERGYGYGKDAKAERLIINLKEMADDGRLILDPVFGDVLNDIRKRINSLKKEVSSRG
ncbi:hypothetical protein [Pseudoalteromonas sp.]|uniref:hypothetical protein n=1 Tax=Pseudoalteromonas sp. TaxID=53249 RepID=UPI00272A8767|nr:hypothetical protein [Pseudoalteromonas sp.]